MREVHVRSGSGAMKQVLEVDHHTLVADEPLDEGGDDLGPTPRELALAALGACTAMTVKMYAARKEWVLYDVDVRLTLAYDDAREATIAMSVRLDGELDEEQRARLWKIAAKCPVHRLLAEPTRIQATLEPIALPASEAA